MATIAATTNLRHVRKTINFDGGANNGNLGDAVTVFSTTGEVIVERCTKKVTDTLVCSAATGTGITLGVASGTSTLNNSNVHLLDAEGQTATAGLYMNGSTGGWNNYATPDGPCAVDSNVIMTVSDETSGADITDGTIIVDAWYYPITDDGALAGDDIDVNFGASIASILADTNELQGDWTNGGRLDLLLDAVKVVTDAINSLDNSLTAQQAFNVILSAVAGKVSGADSNAPVFRDIADSKDRITATTDASGNRPAVTVDAS